MQNKTLLLFILIGLAPFVWGKASRFEISASPALVLFGDAIGGGITVSLDYPLLHHLNISWPIKTRVVLFGEMSGGTNTSFWNGGIGIGGAGYYSFPDLSALTIEGGIDIIPAVYGFGFKVDKVKGSQIGLGVIFAPYVAGKYQFTSSWGMRSDITYHAGVYDSFFGYIV
ncbi:MAG: hypothetical protein ACK4HQ_09135, partial [Brevinematales bacterium]